MFGGALRQSPSGSMTSARANAGAMQLQLQGEGVRDWLQRVLPDAEGVPPAGADVFAALCDGRILVSIVGSAVCEGVRRSHPI